MEAFQVFFDKEEMTTSQKKDLLHVKKNTASQWLFSFLKELKNTTSLVFNLDKFLIINRMRMLIISDLELD